MADVNVDGNAPAAIALPGLMPLPANQLDNSPRRNSDSSQLSVQDSTIQDVDESSIQSDAYLFVERTHSYQVGSQRSLFYGTLKHFLAQDQYHNLSPIVVRYIYYIFFTIIPLVFILNP